MSEPFPIGAHRYRAEKMDAMTQFHVVRRLAPVFDKFRDVAKAKDGFTIDALAPIAEAVAQMSDKDSEYIIGHCMSVVMMEDEGGRGWVKVWSLQAGKPMFDFIDMPTMLQITFRVVMDSLGPFSAALPQK